MSVFDLQAKQRSNNISRRSEVVFSNQETRVGASTSWTLWDLRRRRTGNWSLTRKTTTTYCLTKGRTGEKIWMKKLTNYPTILEFCSLEALHCMMKEIEGGHPR